MNSAYSMNPDIRLVNPEDTAKYQAELRKATAEFEGILMAQLFRTMRKTIPKIDLLGNDFGKELYEDLLCTEFARIGSLAQGLGIAELLFRSLGGEADDEGGKGCPEAAPERSGFEPVR